MGDENGRAEDKLADAIAQAWSELDAKAAAEPNEERQKGEALILEWAARLAEILKGPKK